MKYKIKPNVYQSLEKLLSNIEGITPNLNSFELEFLDNMDTLKLGYKEEMQITEKQEDIIDRIYDSLSHKIRRLENNN